MADTSNDKSTTSSSKPSPTPKAETSASKADTSGKAETTTAGPDDDRAVDPRLDNRTGDQRPQPGPIPPQQVHGGYPGDDSDFEDPPSGEPTDPTRSEGPHGRGPQVGSSSED